MPVIFRSRLKLSREGKSGKESCRCLRMSSRPKPRQAGWVHSLPIPGRAANAPAESPTKMDRITRASLASGTQGAVPFKRQPGSPDGAMRNSWEPTSIPDDGLLQQQDIRGVHQTAAVSVHAVPDWCQAPRFRTSRRCRRRPYQEIAPRRPRCRSLDLRDAATPTQSPEELTRHIGYD